MLKAGWTVDTVSELKRLIPTHNADALSVLVAKDERMSCYIPGIGAVDRNRIIAAIAVSEGIERAVVPIEFGDELREHLAQRGIEVISAPEDPARRRNAAASLHAYDPRLLEPEAMTAALCGLFAKNALLDAVRALPNCAVRDAEVASSKCDFGRMLRSVIENEYDRVADMVDGVKLRYDTGWVTVRPVAQRSAFRVVAGSRDAEYSEELCDIYIKKLRKLSRGDNKA
jgi:hypothetical protein